MASHTHSEAVATSELPGGDAHGAFPPFDPETFGSQLFWLAITFGLLYTLMAKVALPRIATILEERNDRIADDLAEAEKLKRETDEAIAAYEQALGEARQNAYGIAQAARDKANLVLSLGPMTLPHGLARIVLAEQLYRAMTIIAGHPYHRV